jgi:hypothetical protein
MITIEFEETPDFFMPSKDEIKNPEFRKMSAKDVFKKAEIDKWIPFGYVKAIFIRKYAVVYLYKYL